MALFNGPALAHTSHYNPGDENRGKDGPFLRRPRRRSRFRHTSAQTIFSGSFIPGIIWPSLSSAEATGGPATSGV